jgi:2-hydroxychromene-2-carboxylate isomerase
MSAPLPIFYFGAMSPYSWFAAERIEQLLPAARWRGVLAGVIFSAHGRTSWGLTDARAAGLADCEARAEAYGLGAIKWPQEWPTSDLHAARAMLAAEEHGLLEPFALSAMRMAFREGADLADRDVVLEAGARVGLDSEVLDLAMQAPALKQALRELNEEALAAGVFGVPSVLVGEELFWGDDRLDDAAQAYRAQSGA